MTPKVSSSSSSESSSLNGGFKLKRRPLPPTQTDSDEPDAEGWNLIGMIDHRGGIGNAARSNIDALRILTARHRIISFPSATYSKAGDMPAIHGRNYLHFNPDSRDIRELQPLPWFINGVNVGYWAWETSEAPARWQAYAPHMAQVWVPSKFVREALIAGGIKSRIYVVPHAIDTKPQHSYPGPDEPITFLVQWDGHSRFARKRPDLSMEAITRAALATKEKVRIIVKCHHSANSRKLALTEYPGLEIELVDRWLTTADMDHLWSLTDILVSMNRGEGFGLPMMEAMSRGVAAVATHWGGSLDYMTHENSFPVQYQLEPVINAGDGYFKTGNWPMPSVEHATQQIIACMESIRSGRIYGMALKAREMAAAFSQANMMDTMKLALAEL